MKRFAPVLVLISSVLWGSMGIVTRYVAALGFTTIQTTAVRLLSAAVMLVLIQAVRDYKKLKIKAADLKWFFCSGIFSLLLNNAAYAATVQMASLSVAVVLLYTAPFLVMVMSAVLFKEKITVWKLTALCIAFAGCILTVGISGADVGNSLPATITAGLLAALGYSLYSIFGKILVKTYDSITVTAYTFVFASVGASCFARPADMAGKLGAHADKLPVIVIGSVITLAVPYVTYSAALKYMESSKASIIASFEVVAASIFGAVLYDEMPDAFNFLGIVLVVAALVILQVRQRKLNCDNEQDEKC